MSRAAPMKMSKKAEEKKPESQGWFAKLWGSKAKESSAAPTKSLKKEKSMKSEMKMDMMCDAMDDM